MFEQIDVNDHATLFHLFVEIWCDQSIIMTEGMNIFGLPDICVLGFEANSPAAQATAFSLGAQLVCDELKVNAETPFRASESFPWCSLEWIEEEQEVYQFFEGLNETQNGLDLAEYPCGLVVVKAKL